MIPLNTPVSLSFVGDGTEQIEFPVSFPTFEESNIEAEIINPSGVSTTLVKDTHYVLDNIGIPNTDATFILQIDPSFDWTDTYGLKQNFELKIKFSTNAFQPAKLRDLGRFAPEVLEKVADRLTMNVLAIRDVIQNIQLDLEDVNAQISVIADENAAQQLAIEDLDLRLDALETQSTQIETKSENFSAEYDKVYIVQNLGAVNVTLPLPELGKSLNIKKLGDNSVVLIRNGSEKIDNIAANKNLTSAKESVTLISDGVDWFII